MESSDTQELKVISKKLSALLSVQLRLLLDDREFGTKRKSGAGELVRYLALFGLDSKEIAEIIGSPVTSVRTLMTPTRRRTK
jgi:DNA-directed RNA polymerase specialized sigma24 family protein